MLFCLSRCTQGGLSLAHFWKIVMISSQPSEQYGFTTLFLFLLFLNSDIGIVILYIVKYIRKAFSLPKKINFEVQNLTNIHVFRFAFSDLYCYHTDLQNAWNAVSDNLIFKISWGGMPPNPPSKERLRRSLVRIINWSHPPVKNPGYGPAKWNVSDRLQDSPYKLLFASFYIWKRRIQHEIKSHVGLFFHTPFQFWERSWNSMNINFYSKALV